MGSETPQWRRRLLTSSLVVAAVLVLSGCSAEGKNQIERIAMPAPRSVEAQSIYDLWHWTWLAAILTGLVTWSLIFYAVIHYRRRSDDEIPVQTRYNLPIEIFYTIAPVMMVIVFFFFTLKAQEEVLPSDANVGTPDHKVLVVGQQWSWAFNYTDAVDGKTVHDSGTPANRPTLWLPVDKKVRFDLYSPDVIHSFWVPSFLFKMDVVPGRDNHFSITPNRVGSYAGKCAELCGVYHSRMLFNVRVVTEADFQKHLQDLADKGNVGVLKGTTFDNQQPGLEPQGGTE